MKMILLVKTPMVRRGIKNITRSDAHAWGKHLCIDMLTGTYKNARQRLTTRLRSKVFSLEKTLVLILCLKGVRFFGGAGKEEV